MLCNLELSVPQNAIQANFSNFPQPPNLHSCFFLLDTHTHNSLKIIKITSIVENKAGNDETEMITAAAQRETIIFIRFLSAILFFLGEWGAPTINFIIAVACLPLFFCYYYCPPTYIKCSRAAKRSWLSRRRKYTRKHCLMFKVYLFLCNKCMHFVWRPFHFASIVLFMCARNFFIFASTSSSLSLLRDSNFHFPLRFACKQNDEQTFFRRMYLFCSFH